MFRSPCASTQTTPPGPCAAAIPTSEPSAIEWSPPSTSGVSPRSRACSTSFATRSHNARICGRKRARVIVDRERLRNRRLDVAEIVRHDAERLREMLRKLRIANRRRTHVDAAPAGAEIERSADQSHVPLGRLRAHRRKANVPPLVDPPEAAAAPVRVLLADDDGSFLESLRPLIEHQPELTVVGTAENGLDAIELADELDPDAVVIDLHMPLVDGVTAVARLRKDHPSICLIALTGDPDRQLHEAVAEAGADAVLQKADLVDTLVDRLAARRAHRLARLTLRQRRGSSAGRALG